MTAFARANQLGGEDDTAEFAMQQSAAEQGMQVSRSVSVASDVLVHRIIDDATILGLDRQIFHNAQGGAIPPPRSSLETLWTNGYRADLGSFPALSGFVQVRNARGELSLPSELLIVSRDTWDYNFNSALNPVLRLGRATFSFNTGLQVTVRRDREDPYDLNQNLFRQFAYMSSNAIGNWLTVQGEAYHEAGPFNDQNLHSRELGAQLQFIVGHPVHHQLRNARSPLSSANSRVLRDHDLGGSAARVRREAARCRTWTVHSLLARAGLELLDCAGIRALGRGGMEAESSLGYHRRFCLFVRPGNSRL
jgi:hypothetical protein